MSSPCTPTAEAADVRPALADLEGQRHAFLRGRKLRFKIPRELRQSAFLTNFKLELGPARSFVSRTGCPKTGYDYAVALDLGKTTAAATAESNCR